MASTATTSLNIEKLEPGVATSWGDEINVNWDIVDAAIAGRTEVSLNGGDATLADVDYTLDAAKYGTLYVDDQDADNRNIIIPDVARTYRVVNGSGSYNCKIYPSGASGAAITIPSSSVAIVSCDGASAMEFTSAITNITTGAPNTSSGAAASSVSVTPSGDLSSTDVQAALVELQGDIDTIEASLSGSYQPIDADLTTIAGLSSTKGNLIIGGASGWAAMGIGTDGYALIADSASTPGGKWAALIPASTGAIFYQASAPTGWTAVSLSDYGLRVVTQASGTGGSTGDTGGTTAYSSVLTDVTISSSNLPSHRHAVGTLATASDGSHTHSYGNAGGTKTAGSGGVGGYADNSSGTTGADGAHTHTITGLTDYSGGGVAMDFGVQTADVIICTKDAY